jgi:hypothetical protein
VRVCVVGGGRGFIGDHLVRAFHRAEHGVAREWVDIRDLLRSSVRFGVVMRSCILRRCTAFALRPPRAGDSAS